VSPIAFTSLAFLQSILIHEINHVLLGKTPPFAAMSPDAPATPSQGRSFAPPPDLYAVFFNLRHARTPGYQYHLLHEYYSFRAQLLYDDLTPSSPYYRLPPSDRRSIERLCAWSFSELNESHQAIVRQHPDPPIAAYLERFSRQ
jgi:hypothetical protein